MTQRTVLYDEHVALGATFTDFAGFDMPVRYSSDLLEHSAVRTHAGVFDLSHMGEIFVRGKDADKFLDFAIAGIASTQKIGQAKYALLLADNGGIIDDLIVYRLAEAEYLIVANASNIDADASRLHELLVASSTFALDVTVTDESEKWALVAIQGTSAAAMLARLDIGLTTDEIAQLRYYRVDRVDWMGTDLLVARTGYTGEDGFELLLPKQHAVALWQAAMAVAPEFSAVACGLACRDTLRLEAGMPLYGHELGLDVTPWDAGFTRQVAIGKPMSAVSDEVLETLSRSSSQKLVGLVGKGKRAARAGMPLVDAAGTQIGHITSGVLSPTLGYPIAMGYVSRDLPEDAAISASVRGKLLPMEITKLPFYKRTK